MYCDIAPIQGRDELEHWLGEGHVPALSWQEANFFIEGEQTIPGTGNELTITCQSKLDPVGPAQPTAGWVELETSSRPAMISDLILVGSRPLPRNNLSCICRHPGDEGFLWAGTDDAHLLLMDAHLPANLRIVADIQLAAPLKSLVCCGTGLLGLEAGGERVWEIAINDGGKKSIQAGGSIELPKPLIALAENDRHSAWGLTESGELYAVRLDNYSSSKSASRLKNGLNFNPAGCLGRRRLNSVNLEAWLRSTYRAALNKGSSWKWLGAPAGRPGGLAFDGQHFWSYNTKVNSSGRVLRMYDKAGRLRREFPTWPEVAISDVNYCHLRLLVLDRENQQLHQYQLIDDMEPTASAGYGSHPGFLPAGREQSAGIHDLCLVYVGGAGKDVIYRCDQVAMRPIAGYVDEQGQVKDRFMDGFLFLSQHSPLLNGRVFAPELKGAPSRQEDWLALFAEYFQPAANLAALDKCIELQDEELGQSGLPVKVVLGIPTADPRCINWDQSGYSLSPDENRIEVTRWAMQQLLESWSKANFQHLQLAGFYYLSEQGAWDDRLLHSFPRLCREWGLRSFAIPGITSKWITEFCRADFDCVVLQSSHAFWSPFRRPRHFALKCAGLIAREFGMGVEVEIPYDILEPAGMDKLRDYLQMAQFQGWAGSFKAYFQSYELIQVMADGHEPAARKLYEDLFRLSMQSRRAGEGRDDPGKQEREIRWRVKLKPGERNLHYRLNWEGHQGNLILTSLTVK